MSDRVLPNLKQIALDGLILRCEVGSGVHGLALEGTDDRDEMGVTIEPPVFLLGLQHFEQYVQRDKPEGVRSQPGDLDLVIYSLRKWASLAMKGNPSILLLLFAEPLYVTWLGKELQELAPLIVSREAGPRFLGYLEAQKQRLLRERGTARMPNRGDQNRKYASHMVRLGYQGVELLSTGRISLPMPQDQRDVCLAIKRGDADENEALNTAGILGRELEDLMAEPEGLVPDHPDRTAIDRWLVDCYMRAWNEA